MGALLLLLACVPEVEVPDDADGDGYGELDGDCDDGDARVSPGAVEACDGVDNDCDGTVDTDTPDPPAWYPDADGDGAGAEADAVFVCDAPPDHLPTGGDCDDGDPSVHPGATEICDDGVDQDCDGAVEEACVGWPAVNGPEVAAATVEGDAGYLFAESFLGVGDLDGDGVGELLVGEPAPESVYQDHLYVLDGPLAGGVHAGDGLRDLSTATWGSGFGSALAVVGDLLAVGAPGGTALEPGGEVRLFPLADWSTWDVDAPPATVGPGVDGASFGRAVAAAGDLDGDGTADLAVGAPYHLANGAAFVYAGGGAWTAEAPTATILPSAYAEAGRTLAAAGDLDGDGYDDLAVGLPALARGSDLDVGAVWVFRGPVLGQRDSGDAWCRIDGAGAAARLGDTLRPAGDLTGDGRADLVATAPGTRRDEGAGEPAGAAHVLDAARLAANCGGGAASVGDLGPRVSGGPEGVWHGISAAGGPDWDGDGAPDLLVGAGSRDGSPTGGLVALLPGPLAASADVYGDGYVFEAEDDAAGFADDVGPGGDLTGDGNPDFLVRATVPGPGRIVYVYAGRGP